MGSSKKTTSTSTIATEEGYNAQLQEVERLRKLAKQNPRGGATGPSLGSGSSNSINQNSVQGQLFGGGRGASGSYSNQLKEAEAKLAEMSGFVRRSDEEKQALGAQSKGLSDLQRMIGIGPGDQDITAGLDAQRNFASMLEQFSKGGFQPGEADISSARGTVNQLFAGQQTALNQQLEDQRRMAQRNAALTGRGINDPIFQNQLAQTQTRQQQLLESQMTSATAEQAQNMPMQRLQFAEGLAQTRLSLGNQAMQNRQLLLGLGNQIREQERNFRLNAANKTQTQVQKDSPGALGVMAGIAGGIGAMGTGLSALGLVGGAANAAAPVVNAATGLANIPQGFNLPGSPVNSLGGGGSAMSSGGGPQFSASQILAANAAPMQNFNQLFNSQVTNSTPAYATQGYNTNSLWNRMSSSNTAASRARAGFVYGGGY